MGSGLPDVWWFRADGNKMTRRDWQGGEHVLGMFLNGREIPTPGPQGQDVEDDSFVLLFNAEPEDRVFTLPRRRFGAQWLLELSTADPVGRGRQRALRRPHRCQGHRAVDRGAEAGHVTSSRPPIELRATYRLQLSSDFGFADARALVPYLRDLGISHLYLSPSLQARRGSTHGYDVVDPRHFSRELGGPRSCARCRRPRATPAWGSCSMSSRTTWPPTIRTATGRTHSSARSSSTSSPGPASTAASSTSASSRASARRIRRCSRRRTSS